MSEKYKLIKLVYSTITKLKYIKNFIILSIYLLSTKFIMEFNSLLIPHK